MNTQLLDTAIELVRARGEMTLRQVADGAGVDFEWLSKFSRGEIADPGVQKVQRVHDFLFPLIELPRKRRSRAN